ncbi:MAG: protein phosphatase 1 regulatory subunit 42 [bacterium]|nr:protein phosphatase 1 regulatory subunit 42 [bacterium]
MMNRIGLIKVVMVFGLVSMLACGRNQNITMIESHISGDTLVLPLCNLNLENVPEEIGEFKELKVLRVVCRDGWTLGPPLSSLGDGNKVFEPEMRIGHFPESVKELKKLKVLTISQVGLKTLPNELHKLEKLEYLDISDNAMTISDELHKIEKLKSLKRVILIGNYYELPEIEK